MADFNIGQINATTWVGRVGKKPNDNAFNPQTLFKMLGKDGYKESVPGGSLFEFTLELAENTNFGAAGFGDQIATTRQDVFDAAQYPVAMYGGAVSWLKADELRAQSDSAKIDLVAGLIDNGKNSHFGGMNRDLYGSGANGKSFLGFKSLIPDDPTTGSVGGVDAGIVAAWRSRQFSGAKSVTAGDNLRQGMDNLFQSISLGDGDMAPEVAVTDQASFSLYKTLLNAGEQFLKPSGKARGGDAGWDNDAIAFNGKALTWDPDCNPANMYMFGPKFLKLAYWQNGWAVMEDKVTEVNSFKRVQKISTYAQLCSGQRRRLGVLTAIS